MSPMETYFKIYLMLREAGEGCASSSEISARSNQTSKGNTAAWRRRASSLGLHQLAADPEASSGTCHVPAAGSRGKSFSHLGDLRAAVLMLQADVAFACTVGTCLPQLAIEKAWWVSLRCLAAQFCLGGFNCVTGVAISFLPLPQLCPWT